MRDAREERYARIGAAWFRIRPMANLTACKR